MYYNPLRMFNKNRNLTRIAAYSMLLSIILLPAARAQQIPMRITDDGLFVFGTIAGTKVDFMFDTGAGITVISSSLFKQLKASLVYKGPVTGFRHDGERLDGDVYMAPEIGVGNFKAKNIPVLLWTDLDNYGLTAILSLQPFTKQAISIDFLKQQLIVETAESLSVKAKTARVIPVKTDNYRGMVVDVFVPLRLNDTITIDAELDTGTPSWNLVVNTTYINRLQIDSATITRQVYKQLPGGQQLFDQTATLAFVGYEGVAGLQEKNKKTTFRDGLIYEGLIGAGMFKQRVLTIDLNNGRLLVSKSN